MIGKLLDRLAQATPPRAIYQALASLCAAALLGSWIGLGSPALDHPDVGDGRLTALAGSPLAVAYRVLALFNIPHEWVMTVGSYLAADPIRAGLIGTTAGLLGLAVTFTLSPTGGDDEEMPSLQASTWWVCAAVTLQCGGNFIFIMLVVLAGRLALLLLLRRHAEAGMSIGQLLVAVFAVPILAIPLIFDRTGRLRAT